MARVRLRERARSRDVVRGRRLGRRAVEPPGRGSPGGRERARRRRRDRRKRPSRPSPSLPSSARPKRPSPPTQPGRAAAPARTAAAGRTTQRQPEASQPRRIRPLGGSGPGVARAGSRVAQRERPPERARARARTRSAPKPDHLRPRDRRTGATDGATDDSRRRRHPHRRPLCTCPIRTSRTTSRRTSLFAAGRDGIRSAPAPRAPTIGRTAFCGCASCRAPRTCTWTALGRHGGRLRRQRRSACCPRAPAGSRSWRPAYETLTFDVRVPANDTVTFTRELDARRADGTGARAGRRFPTRRSTSCRSCYIGDRPPLLSDMPAGCTRRRRASHSVELAWHWPRSPKPEPASHS